MDTAWDELSATSSKTLQRLQNRAAHIVLRRDSSKDTFIVLGWAELETIRKRHKCVLVYIKCLNNLVPQSLSDFFTRNNDLHSYKHIYTTRRITDLQLPKAKLSLEKELFDIRAQHVLIPYLVAFKRPSHSLLSKF